MPSCRLHVTAMAVLSLGALALACKNSPRARQQTAQSAPRAGIVPIDPHDTAAYAAAGPEAMAAVARCQPPKCRPDIFRGPGRGELTVGLDSGTWTGREYQERQWHLMPDTVSPAGEAAQESGWVAMVTRWEASKPTRLVLVDGVPRSFSYVRSQVPLKSVWDMREVSAKDARALSTDPEAVNGAFIITTRAHASAPNR